MILFEEIDKQALPPSPSRYNGQTSISADLIAPLQGETVSLHRLALKVQRLEDRYKDILLTIVVGIIFAVIAAFLGSYFAAGGH